MTARALQETGPVPPLRGTPAYEGITDGDAMKRALADHWSRLDGLRVLGSMPGAGPTPRSASALVPLARWPTARDSRYDPAELLLLSSSAAFLRAPDQPTGGASRGPGQALSRQAAITTEAAIAVCRRSFSLPVVPYELQYAVATSRSGSSIYTPPPAVPLVPRCALESRHDGAAHAVAAACQPHGSGSAVCLTTSRSTGRHQSPFADAAAQQQAARTISTEEASAAGASCRTDDIPSVWRSLFENAAEQEAEGSAPAGLLSLSSAAATERPAAATEPQWALSFECNEALELEPLVTGGPRQQPPEVSSVQHHPRSLLLGSAPAEPSVHACLSAVAKRQSLGFRAEGRLCREASLSRAASSDSLITIGERVSQRKCSGDFSAAAMVAAAVVAVAAEVAAVAAHQQTAPQGQHPQGSPPGSPLPRQY